MFFYRIWWAEIEKVAVARLHHQHHPVSDIEHKIVRLSFPLCSRYRKLASLTWCRLVVKRLNKGITDLKETGEKFMLGCLYFVIVCILSDEFFWRFYILRSLISLIHLKWSEPACWSRGGKKICYLDWNPQLITKFHPCMDRVSDIEFCKLPVSTEGIPNTQQLLFHIYFHH
jgi:hypothetical protein